MIALSVSWCRLKNTSPQPTFLLFHVFWHYWIGLWIGCVTAWCSGWRSGHNCCRPNHSQGHGWGHQWGKTVLVNLLSMHSTFRQLKACWKQLLSHCPLDAKLLSSDNLQELDKQMPLIDEVDTKVCLTWIYLAGCSVHFGRSISWQILVEGISIFSCQSALLRDYFPAFTVLSVLTANVSVLYISVFSSIQLLINEKDKALCIFLLQLEEYIWFFLMKSGG